MTQEEFIQRTMIALMGNPYVTHADNFDESDHHNQVYSAAVALTNIRDHDGEFLMCFDDLNSSTSKNFPDGVSERECLAAIAMSLQAIANKKTFAEQCDEHNGNLE